MQTGTLLEVQFDPGGLVQVIRITPGKRSKPESKLKIRSIPWISMMARWSASRAVKSDVPRMISFARFAARPSTGKIRSTILKRASNAGWMASRRLMEA